MRCDYYSRLSWRVLRIAREEIDKIRRYRNPTPSEYVQHFWIANACWALLDAADDLYTLEYTSDVVPAEPIQDLDAERGTGELMQWTRKGRYTFSR